MINTPFMPNTSAFAGSTNNAKPKAEFWVNIGYSVEVEVVENGTSTKENRFISLPVGIPFDTMEMLNTSSQNVGFSAFQAARNDLHAQIMTVAKTLQPGEERFIGGTAGGLQIQLRRVTAPAQAPAAGTNPFLKAISL